MNLRKIDLNLLVIFDAIYSAGNISHAAKSLGMSQPTISNALTRLRDTVGDPLFTRAGRGIEPTPKAIQMIGPVREALQMIQSGVSDSGSFDPATSKRHFRMVLLDQLEPMLMPPIIRKIQDFKTITLETLHVWKTPVIERLNDGSLDLLLSTYASDLGDFNCTSLGRAEVAMIARRGHPAIDGEVTLEQFRSLGHIALVQELRNLTRTDELLRAMGIDRHIAYTVTKFWSFPYLVAETDLIAMIPAEFARLAAKNYPIEVYPTPFEMPKQKVYMTWKKNRDNDPGHRWLREQIVETCAGNVEEIS